MYVLRKRAASFSVFNDSSTSAKNGSAADAGVEHLVEQFHHMGLREISNVFPEKKPRRSSSANPRSRDRGDSGSVKFASNVMRGLKDVFTHLVNGKHEDEQAGGERTRIAPPLPIPDWTDERKREMVKDNVSYMFSYQCIPLEREVMEGRRRVIFVSWIYSLWAYKPALHPTEAFFLTVYLIDRFLQGGVVPKDSDLEYLGMAALQLAVKYETQLPLSEDLVATYNPLKINKFEILLLNACKFEMGRHTVMHLLRIMEGIISGPTSPGLWEVAKLLAVLSVFTYRLLSEQPSLIAATIIRIAVELDKGLWSHEMQLKTQHSRAEIARCTSAFVDIIRVAKSKEFRGREVVKQFRVNRGVAMEMFTEDFLEEILDKTEAITRNDSF